EDDFGVPGQPGAHLFVRRVGGVPAGVADRGGVHTRDLPEAPFGSPETAVAEDRRLHPLREGRPERRPLDVVLAGDLHRLVTARQRLVGLHHRQLLSSKPHVASPVACNTSQHRTGANGSRRGQVTIGDGGYAWSGIASQHRAPTARIVGAKPGAAWRSGEVAWGWAACSSSSCSTSAWEAGREASAA